MSAAKIIADSTGIIVVFLAPFTVSLMERRGTQRNACKAMIVRQRSTLTPALISCGSGTAKLGRPIVNRVVGTLILAAALLIELCGRSCFLGIRLAYKHHGSSASELLLAVQYQLLLI